MDCTYKTNKFKLSLLVVVGTTCLNTTFYISFCFMANEKLESYVWALEQLKLLFSDGVSDGVIVTD